MTKRVENEYRRYMQEVKGGSPGYAVTINVKDMAQHFYDLALEDVKKELARMERIFGPSHFDMWDTIKHLTEFINKQSK